MPKREDFKSILIIGAGPIVIGQACEFDYSGVQACKALREEGYRVVLINSNPATIMTDPETADVTYIEPIDWRHVEKIIEKERPDALLPTMGGQTALNCALDLDRHGVLEKYNVEMIGATKEAIDMAEDRQLFSEAMARIGLETTQGSIARSMEQAFDILEEIGFPTIIRPSFTMGGSGGGIAYNKEEFIEICERGLEASPTKELLIEESILGWKEYEMEVVRDRADNCIIICSIENFDPMGVHTGDSITVAPAQTLTDKEYQLMRNASLAVLREIGVDTGGSNVQFAIDPDNGRMIVIEMNPRVSRSSALASKATGFPIAKVAAKLAVGFTLNELRNDITGGIIPSSFEPSIDYVVSKVPRFDFEKFTSANDTLTTQMKSVGEAMSIGRTFKESIQKALRSLEIGSHGFEPQIDNHDRENVRDEIIARIGTPNALRIWWLGDAFRLGMSVDEVFDITKIDPWFLQQLSELIDSEKELSSKKLTDLDYDTMWALKRDGFSDIRIAQILGVKEQAVRVHRHNLKVRPVYKRVDSCAAEFPTTTAYMYSTYESVCESEPTDNKKVVVLGGGPNRIGQGIEFDYCCIHAAFALRDDGFETIMVNCNPETVSTDYDTSDRLYFEPLTLEDVSEILHKENPSGVIVQYGGQTPLKLARSLKDMGAPIIGSSPDCIHRAEDRESFQGLLNELNLRQPPNRTARALDQAVELAEDIGYPLVVRPSYVLGGRAMEIVNSSDELRSWMSRAIEVSHESPVLLDRFLDDAIEVDVDAICDGTDVVIGGIMEHIEQAGVHSGDSACSLPPYSLSESLQEELSEQTRKMALGLGVVGLMNVQFAVRKDEIFVLEVNPRASRTVPFVSKATGRPLAKVAALVMAGHTLKELDELSAITPRFYSVKEAVFPFIKFPGVDPILGPEMKSTGEVMGIGSDFGEAYLKSQIGSGTTIPADGAALISVRDADKDRAVEVARYLKDNGFALYATGGTQRAIVAAGIDCEKVDKVNQGRPNVVDIIKNNQVNLVVNTTQGRKSLADSYQLRRESLNRKITYFTTMAGASAACAAHRVLGREIVVRPLQELQNEVESV